jgi:hypothetical protein
MNGQRTQNEIHTFDTVILSLPDAGSGVITNHHSLGLRNAKEMTGIRDRRFHFNASGEQALGA